MNEHYKFQNVPLPYKYNGLEPYIDAKTVMLHHDRHLQSYVDNLNKILKDYKALQNLSLEQLIIYSNKLPREIRTEVKNNAGGIYNHIFYFNGMCNAELKAPKGKLADKINEQFGCFDNFKNEFKKYALSVFGSGYAWLVSDMRGNIKIVTTANQDTPIAYNLIPILCIDVWEHAYYLKHYNKRNDYIEDWFNVVNWNRAEKIYERI